MAILNEGKVGYAVLEINKLQSRTTGQMISNAPLATDFVCDGKEKSQTYAENGMILGYEPTNKKGNENGAIVSGKMESVKPIMYGLVYATEHMYNGYANALKNFRMDRPIDPAQEAVPYETTFGEQKHFQFYPRLYTLNPGDAFTTDAVELGTYTIETLKTALESGPVKTNVGKGYIELNSNGTSQIMAVEVTTLPDGITPAVKFRVGIA